MAGVLESSLRQWPYQYDTCACGGPKYYVAERCWRCHVAAVSNAELKVCPKCGGPKAAQSRQCLTCRNALGAKLRVCPRCQGSKSPRAHLCQHCSGYSGEVELAPIVEAVEEAVANGMSLAQIARRAGWEYKGRSDTSTLQRRLGLRPQPRPNGKFSLAMRYETAVKIVRAIGLAPVDFGL